MLSFTRRTFHTAAIISLFLLLSAAASLPAFADSYTLTTVAHSGWENFSGIDAAGDFVVNATGTISPYNPTCGGVGSAYSKCYETFYEDQPAPVYSTTLPGLTFDNGSSCSPTAASGFSVDKAICNNGHMLFFGEYEAHGHDVRGVWTGFDLADYLGNFCLDGGFINSSGDAVFIDGLHDALIFADKESSAPNSYRYSSPAPVPEPASLLLVGTGGLSLLTAVRRKLRR